MNNPWQRLLFIYHVMSMRGYHLPMSWAMNSTIVNDATYYRSRITNTPVRFQTYLNLDFYLYQSIQVTHT
ncbi:hypothetical protein F383_29261 [Gossypium arboreum]|uniref:Uncharacterized protein n=1 Tax=Gossypium arboreum TaxID=29729 RepID=A0A0B0MUJ3_GOSAR|nr:hypothetical protein F383_29261 [Gossypium arboreum]